MGEGSWRLLGSWPLRNPCVRGVGVGVDRDTGGSGASRGGEGTDRGHLHPTSLLLFPWAAPQWLLPLKPNGSPPSFYPFHPHSLGSHSWRKRHYSIHCRTGGGTGCNESACSLLGPVRTRICTWGNLQGTAGQGWGHHCSSRPSGRELLATIDHWANRPSGAALPMPFS